MRRGRAIEPRLQAGRIRVLSRGSEGEGADRGGGLRWTGDGCGERSRPGRSPAFDASGCSGRDVFPCGGRLGGGDGRRLDAGNRRRGAHPAHLGHHLAPQDRAAFAIQHCCLGRKYRCVPRADAERPLPECDAPLSHPRAGGRPFGLTRRRSVGLLRARLRRAEVLRMDARLRTDLVHGRADHASGDPFARAPQRGNRRVRETALPAIIVGLAAAPGLRSAVRDLWRPGDRELRNDRGDAPDVLQSPSPARAQGGIRRHRGRAHGAYRSRGGE